MKVRNNFNLKGMGLSLYLFMLIANGILVLPSIRNYFFNEIGWRWLYILLVSVALSFCLTPVFGWIAYRYNVLDKPDARKQHPDATPLLGGLAVFSAFIVAIVYNGVFSLKLGVILSAAGVLCGVGAIDDVKEIPAWFKLVTQVLCTLFVMSFGMILSVVPDTFGIFSTISNMFLTVLWIIGITNAMNFFDGMDGLAAGMGGLIAFFLGVVAFQTAQPFLGWVSVAMVGSCIGFLPYNFRLNRPAAIFLGDAGSTVLGFVLACVAVYGNWSESDPLVALASPILIFWLLIFDMVHITIDRILTGKVSSLRQWIDYVGKDHLHHRLEHVLGGRRESVLFIYLLTFCLGASAVVLRNATPLDALLLIFQASIMVVLITVLERRGRSMADICNGIDPE